MTQQELANKLNSAKSSIAMYESEDRKPSMDVLIRLSEIFNCTIDYLLGKSDIKNPEEKDILDEINIGMSRDEYEELTETQKQQIRDFAMFIKKQHENKK